MYYKADDEADVQARILGEIFPPLVSGQWYYLVLHMIGRPTKKWNLPELCIHDTRVIQGLAYITMTFSSMFSDVLHMLCLHSLNEILRYPAHSARCAAYIQRSVDMHLLGNHPSASLVCVDQADCWMNKAGKGRKIGSMLVTKQLYRWWQNQTKPDERDRFLADFAVSFFPSKSPYIAALLSSMYLKPRRLDCKVKEENIECSTINDHVRP
ncbi:uncharacterized protein C8R40DRAFT_434338 [Lentinula edodes]|uniref:uncharacterized protein n=1 Tax=Lentinula edodes TaxID=5353 RepID=UPI001E8EDE37|nr:uncharacterized protein C8R40DRAFT_434338 [Lentinula edodes]KAH7879597.1 hypothetical protein C8R40DRAFT_434338 [Lentinula edodes]